MPALHDDDDQLSMMRYTLVSGASGCLGTVVSQKLADDRPLLLHGRDEERLRELRERLPHASWHRLWVSDLVDSEGVGASLRQVIAENGMAVEAFVHCAGVARVFATRGAPLTAIKDSLAVNCVSAQQIVSTLLSKRVNLTALGCVVFVSSIYSRVGVRGHSAYCMSKAALDGLMRALAVELAPLTRVNSVLPGALDTAMAGRAMADPIISVNLAKSYPLEVGTPRDVAGAIAFLLSEEARWITGQQIVVDGGRSINFSLK